MEHKHDNYRCFPHCEEQNGADTDCTCEDKPNMICNPYYVAGHCPDDPYVSDK